MSHGIELLYSIGHRVVWGSVRCRFDGQIFEKRTKIVDFDWKKISRAAQEVARGMRCTHITESLLLFWRETCSHDACLCGGRGMKIILQNRTLS